MFSRIKKQFNLGLVDIIVTPIYASIVLIVAFWYRKRIKDTTLKRYFVPALVVKIVGAISVGLVYQFYYTGGDTFNYFNQGSVLHEAFFNDPVKSIDLFLRSESAYALPYVRKIYWYTSAEFFIIKVSALFSILGFDNYSTVAILFAATNFLSLVLLYGVFAKELPKLNTKVVLIIFFIPSLFFWSSGITKDTLAMTGLNFLIYGVYSIFIERKISVLSIILTLSSIYILNNTKVYILIAAVLALSIWMFMYNRSRVRSRILRVLVTPILIILGLGFAFYGTSYLVSSKSKFRLQKLSETAYISSLYHSNISSTSSTVPRGHGGSGYEMQVFDGTIDGMLFLAPKAITLSLFRPFPWEVRNPLMLLAALESLFLVYLTFLSVSSGKARVLRKIKKPVIVFCFIFSITIALATGLTSGNFGNLSRYRIPSLQFYCIAMVGIAGNRKVKQPHITLARARRASFTK
ncbi:MAG: hypothetical protein ABJG78_05135 [Cyclobacteriaceae bacterium]